MLGSSSSGPAVNHTIQSKFVRDRKNVLAMKLSLAHIAGKASQFVEEGFFSLFDQKKMYFYFQRKPIEIEANSMILTGCACYLIKMVVKYLKKRLL